MDKAGPFFRVSFYLLWLRDDGRTQGHLMVWITVRALWWPRGRTAGAALLLDVHEGSRPLLSEIIHSLVR